MLFHSQLTSVFGFLIYYLVPVKIFHNTVFSPITFIRALDSNCKYRRNSIYIVCNKQQESFTVSIVSVTCDNIPAFFPSYNKKQVTTWLQKTLYLRATASPCPSSWGFSGNLHGHISPASLLPVKGLWQIYLKQRLSQCCQLARAEAYSRELLLQHCETPCLKTHIATHNSHTIFLFLICQV